MEDVQPEKIKSIHLYLENPQQVIDKKNLKKRKLR